MNERMERILEDERTFSAASNIKLIGGNIFDYFLQDVEMELNEMYEGISYDEKREDIKELREIIDEAESRPKREFLAAVIDILENML